MSADKTLNLIDITAAGREVPMEALGRESGPLAFARDPNFPPLMLAAPVFINRPAFAQVFPAGAVQRHEPMLCAVENCFLLGPFGYVVLPSGQLLRQSLINLDGDSIQYSLDQFKGQFPGSRVPWSSSPSPVFSVNGYATNNYFHFLMDALAQLHWCERAPTAQAAKYVVTGYPPEAEATLPFMASALNRAGIAANALQPFDGTILFCRKLIFPRRNTGANPAKVRWLRQRFGVAGEVRGKARLYITRKTAQRRRITNEPAVEKLLAAKDFIAVDPGTMTVPAQVALFAGASVVVGAHGAALTNAAFMPPGGTVIELTHAQRVVWTYHEVAAAAGLAYACVIGDVVGDDSQPVFSNFSIEIDALEQALKAANI